ncbi:BPSL0761 family protein [Pseudomonas aeruginosa]|nr:BPSL0761 family protein [Pseudomonas aeruginosa]MDU0680289.1 BPSL0761 family protein [Pseudomonas aeruginosa]
MPHERTWSVLRTRAFLTELASNSKLDEPLRSNAEWLLHHYPTPADMHIAGVIEQSSSLGTVFQSSESHSRYGWPVPGWSLLDRIAFRLARLLISYLAERSTTPP